MSDSLPIRGASLNSRPYSDQSRNCPRVLGLRALSLVAVIALNAFCVGNGFAAPTDEIRRANIAGGAASIESATAAQFVKAFNSVAIRTRELKLSECVTAGIKLRGDLAPQITVAALRVGRSGQDFKGDADACQWVDPIVRAAIAAAPATKSAIIRAAVEAEPYAEECIFAAAGMQKGDTETAFFRPSGVDAGNINSASIGTINPGNFSGQGNIVSPFQP